MRLFWTIIGLTTLILGFVLSVGLQGRVVQKQSAAILEWSKVQNSPALDELTELEIALRSRAAFYEAAIQRDFLVDGMLVNRGPDFEPLDICDSLLFSSIRYVALHKLGWRDTADAAWQSILASKIDGQWARHPRCGKYLSRDMLLGVLAALTLGPSGHEAELRALGRTLGRGGFFSDGPFWSSFMSPGIAELLRNVAESKGERVAGAVPGRAFSVLEFNAAFAQRGYTSHLIGLGLWTEMELRKKYPERVSVVTLLSMFDGVLPLLAMPPLGEVRDEWIAQRLVDTDAENLFFRWLRFKTAGALSPGVRAHLIRDLLAMPQFPDSRLPSSCDRKADYLWQRDSREFDASTVECRKTWNGVDFLWLAGLILEDGETEIGPVQIPLAH